MAPMSRLMSVAVLILLAGCGTRYALDKLSVTVPALRLTDAIVARRAGSLSRASRQSSISCASASVFSRSPVRTLLRCPYAVTEVASVAVCAVPPDRVMEISFQTFSRS